MAMLIKSLEAVAGLMANGAWLAFSRLNRIRPAAAFTPAWSDLPLPKLRERSKPPLGWPRETDSLCPDCVREVRADILAGRADPRVLTEGRPGEIKAVILERGGQVVMRKECARHGVFEDVISIDPAFLRHVEQVFPGRDIAAHNDAALHAHGSSSIRY